MFNRIASVTTLASLLLAAAAEAQIPVGSAFTYQGRLTDGAGPASGTHDLSFQLWRHPTSTDALDHVAGPICVDGVDVVDGLFSVDLDFGASSFNGEARWLSVGVRADSIPGNCGEGGGYTGLAPRQRLAPAPFSIATRGVNVDAAGNVGISTNSPSRRLHVSGEGGAGINGIRLTHPVEGSNWDLVIGGSANSFTGGFAIADEGVARLVVSSTGNVGIGTTNAPTRLTVQTPPGSYGISHQDGTVQLSTYVAGTGGWLGTRSNNPLHFYTNDSVSRMMIDTNGNVGIGTTTPGFPLTFPNSVGDKISLWGQSGAHFGFGVQGNLLQMHTASATGDIVFGYGSSAAFTERMRVKGNGNVGIGTSSPAFPLHIATTAPNVMLAESSNTIGTWSRLRNTSAGGHDWITISSGSGNGEGAGNLMFYDETSGVTRMILTANGNVGIGVTAPAAKLHVNGTTRTNILQITGGSDVAEPYNIAPAGRVAAAPGMVVSIDPQHIGQLRVCDKAADSTVAGIVSGANGINPGLTLTQEGSVADGALPVASVGRVWCWVDADAAGPIVPGDLLTSSATPGHAMKVVDRGAANGAILGKAMSSLESGRGLVLVLVALQ